MRVLDNPSGALVGCSRFYDLDPTQCQLAVGSNRPPKSLMLGHAFRFVDRVIFHVGAANIRSRIAMEKLGAVLVGEIAMSYFGEQSHLNVIYKIDKADWPDAAPTG